MKKITKLLALLLVLAMIFSLVACSGSKSKTSDKDDKDDKEKTSDVGKSDDKTDDKTDDSEKETEPEEVAAVGITGKYHGVIAIETLAAVSGDADSEQTQNVMEMFADWEGMGLFITFGENDEFTLEMDKDSLKGMMDSVKNYMEKHLAEAMSMTDEELDAALEEEGMTREQLVDMLMEEFDAEDIVDTDEISRTGTYTLEGNTLTLTSENDDGEKSNVVMTVEIKADALVITGIKTEDEDAQEGLEKVLPWTLEKVG